MDVKYLSGSAEDMKLFAQALQNKRKRKFNFGWGVLPMQRCKQEEAKGVLFQAHVEFRHGSGTLLSWGTQSVARWDRALMLGMFPEGSYGDAMKEIQEHLEKDPQVIWVKPIGTPMEHTYPLSITLVAEPGYHDDRIFVSTYWVGRFLGNGPDLWDIENQQWFELYSAGVRKDIPQASIMTLDEALEVGLTLAEENKCRIDFWAGEIGVKSRAKSQKPTAYLLEVIGRIEAAQKAMEKHNKTLKNRRRKS